MGLDMAVCWPCYSCVVVVCPTHLGCRLQNRAWAVCGIVIQMALERGELLD